MFSVLLVSLCLSFLSGSLFLLAHRGGRGEEYRAKEEEQEQEQEENADVKSQQRGGGLRKRGKVLGMATGMAAETLAVTHFAFVLK